MVAEPQAESIANPEESTVFQKVIGVFTSPAKTFASIDVKPSWLIPLILIIVVNLIFISLTKDIIVEETLVQQEEAMADRGMDSAQIDEATATIESWTGISVWIFSIVGPPIILVVVAGIYMFVGNVVLGGKAPFKKVLSVTSWSWLVFSLGGLILLPLVLSQETMKISFSLATLMSAESEKTFLYRFLQKAEIFTIWWLAVYSIGLGVIYKMKTQKVATAVGSVYLIYALVGSWIAGLFS